jgi:hypothetical protein
MPTIWRRFKRAAEHQLPNHHGQEFKIVVAPAVVSSGRDTVAGLGLVGKF